MKSSLNVKPGEIVRATVKIVRADKPGPHIYKVTNGNEYSEIVTSKFKFKVNDIVDVEGIMSAFKGRPQIEPTSMLKSKLSEKVFLEVALRPAVDRFSITSDRLDSMKPSFVAAVKEIKLASSNGQKILVRHHNDADGILGGLAIEIALGGGCFRNLSKTPFYSIADAVKDLSSTNLLNNSSEKQPLLILSDIGSTDDDIDAIRIVRKAGFKVILVDHHVPNIISKDSVPFKSTVCDLVDVHINPYLYGFDNNLVSGILCYELARFVSDPKDLSNLIPALTAIADRSECVEANSYIEKVGRTFEELVVLQLGVDLVAHSLNYDIGRNLYPGLLLNVSLLEELGSIANKKLDFLASELKESVFSFSFGGQLVNFVLLEKRGFDYPPNGRLVGRLHDKLGFEKSRITVGVSDSVLIFRSTENNISEFAKFLEEKLEVNVKFGGHECAGTLSLNISSAEIIGKLKELI